MQMTGKLLEKYDYYKEVFELEKKAGLDMSVLQVIKRRLKIYKQHKKAFEIGKRAALGYNIYLTFGSTKTVTKDANDSYNRYSMAMKHYGQTLCDANSFAMGYNFVKRSNLTLVKEVPNSVYYQKK